MYDTHSDTHWEDFRIFPQNFPKSIPPVPHPCISRLKQGNCVGN
jgi:hypothetical protein